MIVPLLLAATTWEGGWWLRRRARRSVQFQEAQQRALELKRPLVVIGAPDGGVTSGYGCGDVTVDLAGSRCPASVQADITQGIPFADNSAVVFCSCVLEYVGDVEAALSEIQRVSGGHAFFAGVEPWTLTAFLYPGARRTMPTELR